MYIIHRMSQSNKEVKSRLTEQYGNVIKRMKILDENFKQFNNFEAVLNDLIEWGRGSEGWISDNNMYPKIVQHLQAKWNRLKKEGKLNGNNPFTIETITPFGKRKRNNNPNYWKAKRKR